MRRRSLVFRHLFLDLASHPTLLFRSFLKVLQVNRVDVTHRAGRKEGAWPSFAIPTDYTVFLSGPDYETLGEARERRVVSDLVSEFHRFLRSPAGRVYDLPRNRTLALRLARDTELALETNEYYFAWERRPMPGIVGRLDLSVRGGYVESFDVPEVPALLIGTTRREQVRLDRVTDRQVVLPKGLTLFVRAADGRVTVANVSGSPVVVLVDGQPLAPAPDGPGRPIADGSRIVVSPDLFFTFVADPAPVPSPAPGGAGATPQGLTVGAASPAPPVRPATEGGAAPTPAARLEVIGSVLTTQMFEHAPEGTLLLGSSPRCHLVLAGAGIRPIHAELRLEDGRVVLANRSGRRSVHLGAADRPLEPGGRAPLEAGQRLRIGSLVLRFEAPRSAAGERIGAYFGANYLGDLLFEKPQDCFIVDPAQRMRLIIGRDGRCDWPLVSPYLWPRHAEVFPAATPEPPPDGEAGRTASRVLSLKWRLPKTVAASSPPQAVAFRIRPCENTPDAPAAARATLFVNMRAVLEGADSHLLAPGDRILIGNLIIRYAQ